MTGSIEQEDYVSPFPFFAFGDGEAVLRAQFILFGRPASAIEGAGDDGRFRLAPPGRADRLIQAWLDLDLFDGDIGSGDHIRLLFVLRPKGKTGCRALSMVRRERATRMLERGEKACLVSASLSTLVRLEPEIAIES